MIRASTRQIGRGPLKVFPLGLGCMGLSGAYGGIAEREAEQLVATAISRGVDLLDTADFYGGGRNEVLIGRCLRQLDRPVAISTKTGVVMGPDRRPLLKGRPEQITAACDASLSRLGVETIDLYFLARVDPAVPIEESVGAMADLVSKGKVRQIGLSEVSAATIRRANSVYPLAAIETEYSLAERSVETEILPTLDQFGTTLLAYSPLGRGLLTGAVSGDTSFEQNDFRLANPRFSRENLSANVARLAALSDVAKVAGATNSQVALAWLLGRGKNVVPIFGTRSIVRLTENLKAPLLSLTEEMVSRLDQAFPSGWAKGDRYPESQMALIDQ